MNSKRMERTQDDLIKTAMTPSRKPLAAITLVITTLALIHPPVAVSQPLNEPFREGFREAPLEDLEVANRRGERLRKRAQRISERHSKYQESGEAKRPGKGRRLLKMKRFLGAFNELSQQVKDPHGAIGLAALGIKDYYKSQGEPLKAVMELEEHLSNTKVQSRRNILLFTLRLIYEEVGDQKALFDLNKRILSENTE